MVMTALTLEEKTKQQNATVERPAPIEKIATVERTAQT